MTRPTLPGPGWRFLEGAELEQPLPMDAMFWDGDRWSSSYFRGRPAHPNDIRSGTIYATQEPARSPATEPSDSEMLDALAKAFQQSYWSNVVKLNGYDIEQHADGFDVKLGQKFVLEDVDFRAAIKSAMKNTP